MLSIIIVEDKEADSMVVWIMNVKDTALLQAQKREPFANLRDRLSPTSGEIKELEAMGVRRG